MTSVFLKTGGPPGSEAALSPEAGDQSPLFEGPEVGEGRGWSHAKAGGDLLEARSSGLALPRCDNPKGLDLAMGQLLEGFHGLGRNRQYILATLIIRYRQNMDQGASPKEACGADRQSAEGCVSHTPLPAPNA